MKTIYRCMLLLAVISFAFSGCQKVEDSIDVSLKSGTPIPDAVSENGIIPEYWSVWSPAGGANVECGADGLATCGYGYKIDPWYAGDMSGNGFTITNNDTKTFDWESDYPVCKVIVKAGRGAYVYYYNGAYSDAGLLTPQGKAISHVTFCYSMPQFVIAVKSTYWAGTQVLYDWSNFYWAASTGTYEFPLGWCAGLGYINYPDQNSFSLRNGRYETLIGDVVGSGSVSEGWPLGVHSLIISLQLNSGFTFEDVYVYVGDATTLIGSNLDEGCPVYTSWPWQDPTNANSIVFTIPYNEISY